MEKHIIISNKMIFYFWGGGGKYVKTRLIHVKYFVLDISDLSVCTLLMIFKTRIWKYISSVISIISISDYTLWERFNHFYYKIIGLHLELH